MSWIINHDGTKAIKFQLVDMFYIDNDEEEIEDRKYFIVAGNKEFKSFLFFSDSMEECKKKMKFIIDKIDVDDWAIDLRDSD